MATATPIPPLRSGNIRQSAVNSNHLVQEGARRHRMWCLGALLDWVMVSLRSYGLDRSTLAHACGGLAKQISRTGNRSVIDTSGTQEPRLFCHWPCIGSQSHRCRPGVMASRLMDPAIGVDARRSGLPNSHRLERLAMSSLKLKTLLRHHRSTDGEWPQLSFLDRRPLRRPCCVTHH